MKPNVMKETAQLRLHDNEKNTACHYVYQESVKYTAKYPALSRRNLLYGKRVSTGLYSISKYGKLSPIRRYCKKERNEVNESNKGTMLSKAQRDICKA